MKDEKKMKFSFVTLGLTGKHVWCFSHLILWNHGWLFTMVFSYLQSSKFKCFFQHIVKSPGLWSLNMIKSPIQFVYAGVWDFFHFECIPLCTYRILFQVLSKTQLFLLRRFHYKFKFCCEFWSWMFLNHRKKITSYLDGLNQSHSILSCIFSVFSDHKLALVWSPNNGE